MSNLYLTFCEELELESEEESKWVGWHLGVLGDVGDSTEPEEHPDYDEYSRQLEIYSIEDDYDGYDFQWDITWDGKGPRTLHVFSDESGSPEKAARFLQQYLLKFKPNECLSLEFAVSSDRVSPGSCYGGCAFITAQSVEWLSFEDWLKQKEKEFKRATDKK